MTIAGRARGPRAIRSAFATAAARDRLAFVAYVLAGHRDLDESLRVAAAALDGGADLLEVGVPFSDPVADGPAIAEAGRAAVAAGSGLSTAREVVRALRSKGYGQPILLMTYRNPLRVAGAEVLRELVADGVDGLIVPDQPTGEEPAFERDAADAGLALCFLAAPNTAHARLERVIRASTGFVYVIPRFGVTGSRDRLADGAVELVRHVRAVTNGRRPVAAGFGISAPDHVAAFRGVADGVIVGSLLVGTVTASDAAHSADLVRAKVAALSSPAAVGAAPAALDT